MKGEPHIRARDRVILPLDFPSLDQAKHYAGSMREHVGTFKVGLGLFVREGIEGIRAIQDMGIRNLFVDLKFHDIPETVGQASAALAAADLSIRFLTVHACGGEEVVRAAVERSGEGTRILGVTVLTSMDRSDLKAASVAQSVEERVLSLARIAKRAGGAGIICSSQEVRAVRKEFGPDFIIVTPGIRPAWAEISGDDQRRVATPAEAISNGADYLVIGRPIYRSPDPVQAVEKICAEIEQAIRPRANAPGNS